MRRAGSQKRRFRTFPMLLLLALVAGVLSYMQCGDWLGLGGGGSGGSGGQAESDKDGRGRAGDKGGGDRAAKRGDSEVRPAVGGGAGEGGGRCKLRLDSGGLRVDGRRTTVDEAVAECKKVGEAELTVTGDATVGESDRVHQALAGAGIEVFERERSVPER